MALFASQWHRLNQLFTDECRVMELRDPELDHLARSWSAAQRLFIACYQLGVIL